MVVSAEDSMKKYFNIEPEVAGQLGENAVMDRSVRPPMVTLFHYEMQGWSGDQLLESFPRCFVATEKLVDLFLREKLSGFTVAPLELTLSDEFKETHGDCDLPHFLWLKITGVAGKDNFGLEPLKFGLVVSERAVNTILPECPTDCDVSEYDSQGR